VTLLEVCVDSLAALGRAVEGGAGRLEACSRLDLGGLSPTAELLDACRGSGLPVAAMVRPRGGDFAFSAAEIDAMAGEVVALRGRGVAAVVIGALAPDRTIDAGALRRLVALARPLEVVFHRAFDLVPDRGAALETLIGAGVDRVLTSGGAPTAFEGRAELRRLHELARGRIAILPGGGIRAGSWREVARAVDWAEIHSSTPFELVREERGDAAASGTGP
jgi:copper homeostasis protein